MRVSRHVCSIVRVLLVAALGAMALTACSTGDPTPGAAGPSPSASPSASASPSPSSSDLSPAEQLAKAIGEDDAATAAALLAEGLDPNTNLSTVGTAFPVDIAVSSGSLAVLAVLAEHGADLDAVSGSNADTLVARAASAGDVALVVALIEAGADTSVLPTSTSWGPTHYAGYAGDVEVLAALVGAGVDVDIPDNDGYTALHFAAATGSVEAVRYLVEAGANISEVADNGFTPADSAADRDQAAVLDLLATYSAAPTS